MDSSINWKAAFDNADWFQWTGITPAVSQSAAAVLNFARLDWCCVGLDDAGSDAPFGNLQKVTAEQLHISPVLMGSANSAGVVMGKMISPQSLVVTAAATNQAGKEAEMFKVIFRHSILLAGLVGLLVMIYAYLIPAIVSL